MLSILNKITVQRYMMIMNLSLLAIHAVLLVLFSLLHVSLMVYVNVISIVSYCVCFLLVKKERVTEYIFVTYVEVLIHAVLAIYCVGGGPAFQAYVVGTVAVVFSAQYFSTHIGIKPINGVGMSVVCGIVYISPWFWTGCIRPCIV